MSTKIWREIRICAVKSAACCAVGAPRNSNCGVQKKCGQEENAKKSEGKERKRKRESWKTVSDKATVNWLAVLLLCNGYSALFLSFHWKKRKRKIPLSVEHEFVFWGEWRWMRPFIFTIFSLSNAQLHLPCRTQGSWPYRYWNSAKINGQSRRRYAIIVCLCTT